MSLFRDGKHSGATHDNAIQNKCLNRVKTAFDYESVVVDAIKEQPGPAYLVWTNSNETTDKSRDINDEFLRDSRCQKVVRCSRMGRRTPVARHNKVHDAMIIQWFTLRLRGSRTSMKTVSMVMKVANPWGQVSAASRRTRARNSPRNTPCREVVMMATLSSASIPANRARRWPERRVLYPWPLAVSIK